MNKESIKAWAKLYCLGFDSTLTMDDVYKDVEALSNAVIAIAESYGPKWVSVDTELPEEVENQYDCKNIDVFHDNGRETYAIYHNGQFHRAFEDHQGDFSHFEVITGVTHWMKELEPPTL